MMTETQRAAMQAAHDALIEASASMHDGRKQVIGSGRAKYDRLIKAARNIVQSINASSSWGCVGPDDTDIAWQEFNALASDVCALIDSPPSSIESDHSIGTSQCHPSQHADDVAVDVFAEAMKAKMAKQRAKGYRGWQECPADDLRRMLAEHVAKGDPVDVGNFAMMLFNRGERT